MTKPKPKAVRGHPPKDPAERRVRTCENTTGPVISLAAYADRIHRIGWRYSTAKVIKTAYACGYALCKHADPTEGDREGLSLEEAQAIAREDVSLLYLRLWLRTVKR